jgi:hypothetical protein
LLLVNLLELVVSSHSVGILLDVSKLLGNICSVVLDHVLTASLDSVFYFRCTSLNARLLPQSPRQCFTKRLTNCANSGNLVGTELGNFVLEHFDDLDLEGPRVVGKFGLGVQLGLGNLLNQGPHVKILGEVNSWR